VLYDNFGAMDWGTIQDQLDYMAQSEGCTVLVLDHLTALAAAAEDERKALETIMSELASLAKRLHVIVIFVSHLATPEGTPHEEGGRVMIRHFKGSRAIGFWSHSLIGLERHQQDDDLEERKVTKVRILKHRAHGSAVGTVVELKYNTSNGLLEQFERPVVAPEDAFGNDADDAPF
jgi:twinkle protein